MQPGARTVAHRPGLVLKGLVQALQQRLNVRLEARAIHLGGTCVMMRYVCPFHGGGLP